jgi:hypothetical protein
MKHTAAAIAREADSFPVVCPERSRREDDAPTPREPAPSMATAWVAEAVRVLLAIALILAAIVA